jgi:uncharacterized protein (DUF305 family)
MNTRHRITALLAAATLALAGCSDGSNDTSGSSGSIPDSAPYNEDDVTFATEMIPHHAQALLMVDMAASRDASPRFSSLLDQIRAAQTPEIEQMTDWLEDWDQPVPDTGREHGDMGHDSGGAGTGLDGMMDPEQLDELAGMSGTGFEQMWLRMMIEHHEGAIELAEVEIADGEFADSITLAENIRDAQTAEIETMESMLDG